MTIDDAAELSLLLVWIMTISPVAMSLTDALLPSLVIVVLLLIV
jgi:hypothetical protein